jgi:DNA-binding protein HU-beta
MNRSDLVDAIAGRSGVSKSDVDKTLTAFYDVAAGLVARGGDKLTIPGFLSIEQVTRSARQGRNPQTGERISIPESKGVKISAGSKLKAAAKGS